MVIPDYRHWGLFSKRTVENEITQAEIDGVLHNIQILHLIPNEFSLKFASRVSYYRGETSVEARALLLCFEQGKNNGYGGEHITIIYDLDNNKLLGLTRLLSTFDGSQFVSHQEALEKVVAFLSAMAPDLMPPKTAAPNLITLPPGERMDFVPALSFGNVELNWVGDHSKTIRANDKACEVHGMKVKMYLPKTELWAWLVVEKTAQW